MIEIHTFAARSTFARASRWWLLLALCSLPLPSLAVENSLLQQPIAELMAQLPGRWDGQAITTPIGPVNYDLEFYDCGKGLIAGVASTNASLHYWQFTRQNDALQLRFLSTFAGNRTPLQLLPRRAEQNALHFYAPELALLTLSVATTKDQIDINVFHYGKHHVHIRLNRAEKDQMALRPEQGPGGSCRGLPE